MASIKRSLHIPALVSALSLQLFFTGPAHAFFVKTSQVTAPEAAQSLFRKAGPEPLFMFALKMKDEGNKAEARRSFAEVRKLFPDSAWAPRAAFLLALIALEEGDPGALAYLEESAGLSGIDDYRLFYRAKALSAQGLHAEAAGAYESIILSYPSSLLAEKSRYLGAAALFEGAAFQKSAEAFEKFLKTHPEGPLSADAALMLSDSYIKSGAPEKGVARLKGLALGQPAAASGQKAHKKLAQLDSEGVKGAKLTPEERFRRAEGLLRAASFEAAIGEYKSLSGSPEFKGKASVKTAVALARQKKYGQAEKLLKEHLSAEKPSLEAEALYWYALTSIRQGKDGGALEALKRLSVKFPRSDERGRVMMLLARFKEEKDLEEAVKLYKTVISDFAGSPVSDDAFWNLAWGAYASGSYEDAYEGFSRYLAAKPGGRDTTRSRYWKARSAENLGRGGEAAGGYEEVCAKAPDTFYCLMAASRARELEKRTGAVLAGARAIPASAFNPGTRPSTDGLQGESVFAGVPGYRAAVELLALGLREEAADELERIASLHSGKRADLAEIAMLLYEAGDYYRAFRIYRLHLSADRDFNHLGFPLRIVESVREKSGVPVDPFLVAAVAREESHFNPGAVSPVGALGMMQIMPSTGKGIAARLGESFAEGSLFEPATSIRFGSWYLGHLLERFNGDLALAISGYNAGPNAAERWARSLPFELDEFVESIPYNETRAYSKRVLRSYAEFLRLAGEDPVERIRRVEPYGGKAKDPGEADASGVMPVYASTGSGPGLRPFFPLTLLSAPFQRAIPLF
ncbi:MAG: transglycosylase SLT domain-containing protein [Thermodesulfobacteriota bacterium]|nr:MAG: transglycosylase SLT domain-containing protein [Thermodesulfobacteriota bacterium]